MTEPDAKRRGGGLASGRRRARVNLGSPHTLRLIWVNARFYGSMLPSPLAFVIAGVSMCFRELGAARRSGAE
jgi:hypothetical protein